MKTAVCTLAVGKVGDGLLSVSGPVLAKYADRIGAKLYVYRIPESDYACGEKFRVQPVVASHDRTIYLDADIYFDPDKMPSLFDVVPIGHLGGHDDLSFGNQKVAPGGWIQNEHDALCDSQGWPRRKIERAYNSGVLVLDREHAGFFDQPTKPYPKYHCSEQWAEWLNVLRYGYKTFDLPSIYNWQWWFESRMPSLQERPDIHIRHWAGMGNLVTQEARLEEMRKFAGTVSRAGRRCLNLLERVEVKAGCQGYGCAHKCERSLPAVPGGFCQTCWRFEDDGAF